MDRTAVIAMTKPVTLRQQALQYAASKVDVTKPFTSDIESDVARRRVVASWLAGYNACLKVARDRRIKKIQRQKLKTKGDAHASSTVVPVADRPAGARHR